MRPDDQAVLIAQRRAKAWGLRVEGYSVRRIASSIGCSVGTVHSDLNAERAELTQEAIEEIATHRATLIAREEGLIETHWPMREDPDSAKVIQASNKMIASLVGAFAPVPKGDAEDGPMRPIKIEIVPATTLRKDDEE